MEIVQIKELIKLKRELTPAEKARILEEPYLPPSYIALYLGKSRKTATRIVAQINEMISNKYNKLPKGCGVMTKRFKEFYGIK